MAPLYDFQCVNDHREEVFVPSVRDWGCQTMTCPACQESMGPVISPSSRMLYFEQGRGRVMWNLGPEPVVVHSHAELERKMKEKGLDFAGARRGQKGAWY